MSVNSERLQEAVQMSQLSKNHASDLARNLLRDWVREGVKEISGSPEVTINAAAAAFNGLSYNTVKLLCKALDTDMAGLAHKANNELRSFRAGNPLEIVVDDSFLRLYLKFAVRSAQSVRS